MNPWRSAVPLAALAALSLACGAGQRPRSNRCKLEGTNEVQLVEATPDKWPRVGDACVVADRHGQIVE
jgi:hypothetical protein